MYIAAPGWGRPRRQDPDADPVPAACPAPAAEFAAASFSGSSVWENWSQPLGVSNLSGGNLRRIEAATPRFVPLTLDFCKVPDRIRENLPRDNSTCSVAPCANSLVESW